MSSVSGKTGIADCRHLVIFISSAVSNKIRRDSIRQSWLKYLNDDVSKLALAYKSLVKVWFVLSKETDEITEEKATYHDILVVDSEEGYEHLWEKALKFLCYLELKESYSHVMHADDDSFVRLDLLLPLLLTWPLERFYWGYIWNANSGNATSTSSSSRGGGRLTTPVRNPNNKSYMPESQYPFDFYPPFASGCGFVLSRDLVQALISRPLPKYRLLDPPFGIHLCSLDPQLCVVQPPIVPVHDDRVRPYRAFPVFHQETLVQHYLKPEEMRPFYIQAQEDERQGGGSESGPAEDLYNSLVQLGLFRR